ncbi:hypothetical protein [Collimonas humicola]|uniref:hypothetical protein n=1 Tax=Collimonas humicola TaxID=2825886 RepID=UPI001B8C9E81|nr:hypothetical protein [Collimonas humicola]
MYVQATNADPRFATVSVIAISFCIKLRADVTRMKYLTFYDCFSLFYFPRITIFPENVINKFLFGNDCQVILTAEDVFMEEFNDK